MNLTQARLTSREVVDTIRSILGLIRRLYSSELPDDFNVLIKVRSRHFKRLDIQVISRETVVVEPNLQLKTKRKTD
jgi:hypothetical protein